MSDASDDIEELLRAAEAAEAAASATLPTAEEERVIIDAAEKRAGGRLEGYILNIRIGSWIPGWLRSESSRRRPGACNAALES